MLVFSLSISIKVAKSLTLSNSKSAYLTLFNDGTGNVYYSEDGVPPEWQYAKNREELEPVARLFVQDNLLMAENLTNLPVSSSLVELITAKHSVDYLLSAKFITAEMLEASANNMKERLESLSKAIEAMYLAGLDESKIKAILSIGKDDESELVSVFNALPKLESNKQAAIDKHNTVDTSAETMPTPTAQAWLAIDTVDAWIALDNAAKKSFTSDDLRKIAKTLGVTVGKGRKSADTIIDLIDTHCLATMTPAQ